MSYGGITEGDVRDLIHGCIFTRGPKDLKNTAVWIGGNNMSAGEQLLAMAQDALFAPFSVSIMLDSNGSNTTAVAAVVKIEETLGDLRGKKVVILAGTGPGRAARGRPAGQGRRARHDHLAQARAGRQGAPVHRRPIRRRGRGGRARRPLRAAAGARGRGDPAQLRPRRRADGARVGVDGGEDAQDRRGPERRAAARHRGRRGQRCRRAARGRRGLWRVRRRQLQDQAAQGLRHASCSRGTTWCSTPRRSPTWRGEW